jgi:hypothetical protein
MKILKHFVKIFKYLIKILKKFHENSQTFNEKSQIFHENPPYETKKKLCLTFEVLAQCHRQKNKEM